MDRHSLDKRLQELSIYSDFYYRKELKLLAQLLEDGEVLNCILTGVHDGNRKMLAVTDSRLLIVFSAPLGSGEVKVIRRDAVGEALFRKKLLSSSVSFTAGGEKFVFTNTQGRLKELFDWAMEQPLTSRPGTGGEL